MQPISFAYHQSVIGSLHREADHERLVRIALRRRASPSRRRNSRVVVGRAAPARQS